MHASIRFVSAALLAASLAACQQSTFDPPRRDGPIGLVDTGSGKQAWLTTSQEEERSRHVGGGSRRVGKWITEYYYHLRLQAHDPDTARRLWLKELKVLRDKEGGRGAGLRILGQQGDIVWVWVHDQVLALSARDGAVVADRARIVQANPGIADAWPSELEFHTFVGELVVTLADARRVRISLPDFRAMPYQAPDEKRFRQAVGMGTTWNGGYRTEDFGVRHGRFDGAWIGLLSEREARNAEDDESGDHYADSADIDDERAMARRTFWRATTAYNRDFLVYGGGKGGVQGYCRDRISSIENQEDMQRLTQANDIEEYARNRGADQGTRSQRMRDCVENFDEERFKRIEKLDRIAGAGEWLQGRLLKAQASPGSPQWVQRGVLVKPAVRPPLRLKDPDGVLVLHRTRMDAQGRLALSRLDASFSKTLWTAVLPYAELSNRWENDSHLLLYGDWNAGQPGSSDMHEALLSLDLRTGHWNGWDIGEEAALAGSK
jgi:hypothetical protein